MEYDYAVSKEIPVLVFSIDDSVELPEKKIEKDEEKKQKLVDFIKKVFDTLWKKTKNRDIMLMKIMDLFVTL